MRIGKVFGIGLSRTGTRSLNEALRVMGYRAKHYPIPGLVRRRVKKWDALTDIPVIPHYKQFARRYPGSRFVLTLRDVDDWLESCRAHWVTKTVDREVLFCRRQVYGIETFDAEAFRQIYRDHCADVRAHFADQPGRLLEMDICAGDGWEALCPFLEQPIIDAPFPHLGNRGGANE